MLGLRRLITYLTGMLLAKNDKEVATTLDPTPLVESPFPISLLSGLTFEELETEALVTFEPDVSLFVSPKESMLKKDLFAHNQFTLY